MSAKKDTFIVRKKYRNQIQKLTWNQRRELMDCMFSYQIEWKYESNDGVVSMLLDIMIDERENDDEKYLEVCVKNRTNWKLWWRPRKNHKNPVGLSKPKKADKWYMINDSDIWITNNLISTNVDIEQSSTLSKDISSLIDLVKQQCDDLGIAYDKYKDRYFAKFILTAKEYWSFCEKIGQTRVEFALNVLKVSVHINYRKWITSWPMKIYQNYADVYNEAIKWKAKHSKNLIQSF